MAYQLQRLGGIGQTVDAAELQRRVEQLLGAERVRLERLWGYYRNPMRVCAVDGQSSAERPYRQAQEWGLPERITGSRSRSALFDADEGAVARKEVVIENDIGWRIDTAVDYLFGRHLVVDSAAPDPARAAAIGKLLRAVLAHNGGILFLQKLALLGAVYGHVDVLVKLDVTQLQNTCTDRSGAKDLGEPPVSAQAHAGRSTQGAEARVVEPACQPPLPPPAGTALPERSIPGGGSSEPEAPREETDPSRDAGDDATSSDTGATLSHDDAMERIARLIRLEIVEPARSLPFLCPADPRQIRAYAQCYRIPRTPAKKNARSDGFLARLRRAARLGGDGAAESEQALVVEIITATRWQRYEDEALVDEGENSLGQVPLVHIQNTAEPFSYSGGSEVEPLIPLQDELNTRLSDRASRIALQSFKMYLGKGIDNFLEMPVSPGRMWMTDNAEASVEEFGGDANAPSELAHIQDLREAMDKLSGVTPIAAGAIKGRIGRLTSAAALRITLLALLSKTEKKRTTYGSGIERLCDLALAWLDRAGLFATAPAERRVEIHWPSPMPENAIERLQEAQMKQSLGVPREVILRELGY